MSTYSIFTYQFQRIKKGADFMLELDYVPSVSCTDDNRKRWTIDKTGKVVGEVK